MAHLNNHPLVQIISQFLRKQLKLDQAAPLFIYVNSAFVPSPDQTISDLFEVNVTPSRTVLVACFCDRTRFVPR